MMVNRFVRIKSAIIISADKRGKKTHTVSMRRTQTLLPGIPRMTAGRWAASQAAEFPMMSSILEAGVRPEARGQGSPASDPDSLRSSLCCRGQLRRWAGRGRSSRAGARDLGSQCYPLGGRREVQEVRPGIRGHEDLLGGRAWHRGDRRGNPGLEEGRQLLQQGKLVRKISGD